MGFGVILEVRVQVPVIEKPCGIDCSRCSKAMYVEGDIIVSLGCKENPIFRFHASSAEGMICYLSTLFTHYQEMTRKRLSPLCTQ